MKFKFSKNLDYQIDAINAVVDIFDSGKNEFQKDQPFELQGFSPVVSNELEIDLAKMANNLHHVQLRNGVESTAGELTDYTPLDFSVEMETGTGKTYVYLRTILELNKKYNLKKFIILVPSVAIREGVLKTLEQTKEHFRELYGVGFGYFAYDSNKLSKVRDFAQSLDIQIMIMTVQSFAGNERLVMKQTPDRFHGERPIDLVIQTKPIVIMDEPQNMESDLAKSAIADLQPLFKLRYSATHKELHNLVYRLTPVDAYKKNLVKKISVYGVKESDANSLIFKVREINAEKSGLKAKVILEIKNTDGTYRTSEIMLKPGDDIEQKSKGNQKYEGMVVTDINAKLNRVEVGSDFYFLEADSENKEAIFRTQIHQTIKTHFDKQQEIGNTLKVLSLFFIDKVNNYVLPESIIKTLFIEEFIKLQKNYDQFKSVDVKTVHKGYFASKKTKGIIEYKDSTDRGSKEDKETYNLIMKNKEQLLSFTEPVCFIFSHSALKEGWDNPNIFQICTLKETHSVMKKRQEIGRGLRLPVDVNGDRIYDPETNILTVIANASYEEYAGGLQQEFIDAGYKGSTDIQNAKEQRVSISTTKHIDSVEFKELWSRISKRTKFNLEIDEKTLIKKSVEVINTLSIGNITVTVEKGQIYFDENNIPQHIREVASVGYKINNIIIIQNVIDRIARDSGITRATIFEIFSQVENIEFILKNPEEYVRSVILIIKTQMNSLLINEGLRYIPTGERWEIKLLYGDLKPVFENKTIKSDRSVTTRIVFDSNGERDFAKSLENSLKVKVYTKLPHDFVVETPLGNYNPDWAIVWQTTEGEKMYLVRETKFDYENLEQELTFEEKGKIKAAKKHFETIDADFKVAESKDLIDLL